MKRIALIAGFGLGLLLTDKASGALVAGWDFSAFSASGVNSINGTDFVGAGSVAPNYTDLLQPSPGIAAASYGGIYYDGSFGSTDTGPANFNAPTAPASGNLISAGIQTADGNPFNDAGSYAFLRDSGQIFTNNLALGIQQDSSLVFSADLTPAGEVGSGWELRFAAKELTPGESSSISWEASTDGVSYTALGGVATVSSDVDTEYVIAGGSALEGASTVYFRGAITGVGTQLLIDNVGIHASLGAVSATWAGYPISTNSDGSRWADTGAWLGFVNIDSAPYIFSWELQSWMYFPEPAVEAPGAWIYVFKN